MSYGTKSLECGCDHTRKVAHHSRAFTLVELLVVIGIIAVLIAILLPALSAARRQAAAVKCAAGLKDLGNAMLLYVHDNRGYLPAVVVNYDYHVGDIFFQASAGTPEPPGVVSDRARWFNLLGKYVMKGQISGAATTADEMNQQFQKTVIWGCPAYTGYIVASDPNSLKGDINRNYPPYSMNVFPTFSQSEPPPGAPNHFPTKSPGGNAPFMHQGSLSATGGTWYKLVQFKQPAQRALLGDARALSLQARRVSSIETIPGQMLLQNQGNYVNGSHFGTTFDFYRHGKYPEPFDANVFSPHGGKVAFNILFSDMHVETAIDRATGYRVLRMRFPD